MDVMKSLEDEAAEAVKKTFERMNQARYSQPRTRRGPYEEFQESCYRAAAQAVLHVMKKHGS